MMLLRDKGHRLSSLMAVLCACIVAASLSGCGDKQSGSSTIASSSGSPGSHWTTADASQHKLTPDQAQRTLQGTSHNAPPGSAMPVGGPKIPGVNAPK